MKTTGIIIGLLLTLQLAAQMVPLPQAGVHTISGKASVMRKGKIIFLKQGDYIFSTDSISVKKSASLTLLTQALKYIEVRQPGSYAYKDLEKGLGGGHEGITEKYLELIWHDFLKPEYKKTAMTSKAIGGATGGAGRSNCNIKFEPLTGTKTSDDTLVFSWSHLSRAKSYRFILVNDDEQEILNLITKDTSLILLKRGLFIEGKSYSWSIKPDIGLSADCATAINIITVNSAAGKQKEINEILSSEQRGDDEFIYHLKISNLLGKNGWYKEALEHYLEARSVFKKR